MQYINISLYIIVQICGGYFTFNEIEPSFSTWFGHIIVYPIYWRNKIVIYVV